MVGISFCFDLGRYHATPWGTHVNEGQVEWPPSPWRILRTLYSVGRTNAELAAEREAGERAIGRLAADEPPVYTLPATTEAHTRHYLPSRSWSPARPGHTDLVVDSFRAVAPGDEVTAWWSTDLDATEFTALERFTEAIGYLGRSESVCRAKLVRGGNSIEPTAWPATEGEADVELLCPGADAGLEDLAVSVTDLRRRRRLTPPGSRIVSYKMQVTAAEATPDEPRSEAPQLALFRVGGGNRPGLTEAVAVAQALRSAAQSRFGSMGDGGASPTLSGRAGDSPRSDQHRHAHYLVLSDGSRRRVERVAVWAPEGLGEAEVEALASLRRLVLREAGEPLPLALTAMGPVKALDVPDLLGPARRWRSLTPFGLTRHPKRRDGQVRDGPEDQVRLELARRGLPDPTEVALRRGSWHRFRSSRVGGSRLQRANVFGVRLVFPEQVRGPLALGTLCHFGLGLFEPE